MVRQNEFLTELSKIHNLPEEQIKLVIDSFFNAWRYYLTNPTECKDGIMITGLLTNYIDINKIEKKLERYEILLDSNKYINENHIEFYKTLKQNKKEYERQTTKTQYDEIVNGRIPGTDGSPDQSSE